eukprot:4812801-Amphidinium_carterae.2
MMYFGVGIFNEATLHSRHYGRSTADLSGAPVLLGKDTKPAIGQRVLPVDPDIVRRALCLIWGSS